MPWYKSGYFQQEADVILNEMGAVLWTAAIT